jgi:hypothetical protein
MLANPRSGAGGLFQGGAVLVVLVDAIAISALVGATVWAAKRR